MYDNYNGIDIQTTDKGENIMNVTEAIAEYITDSATKGNAPLTLTYYEKSLGRFANFAGDVEVTSISLSLCKKYYFYLTDSGLASGSVQTYIRGFRAFLHWLYENEYIDSNICNKFKLPKAYQKQPNILTDSEIEKLYASFDSDFYGLRNRSMCFLMLDSGLRLSEVLTLEKTLLHLDDGYCIVNGKCQKQRIVPLSRVSVFLLRSYIKAIPVSCSGSPLVFTSIDGTPLSRNAVTDMFRRHKARCGISRLHPHLLRHTFATKYLENGGNIYALQSILGHTTLEMVKRYLHLSQNRVCTDFNKYSPMGNLTGIAG